jgi:predicted acyl esterase
MRSIGLRHRPWIRAIAIALTSVTLAAHAADAVPPADPVEFQWGVKIPLRDGVKLNATVYTPKDQKSPAPCLFTLTPYIAQS